MLRAMLILRSIAVLAIFTPSDSATQTDAGAIHHEEAIEEIIVKGVNWCGSWPIQHRGLIGCGYAELEQKDLAMVLDLRPKLFTTCLSCQGSRCITKLWPEGKTTEKLLCKRLFWTPTRVAKFMIVDEHSRVPRFMIADEHSSPLSVSFNFTISTTGRVEDVEVIWFEGDIVEEELLELIEDGASKTRFEPVVVEDVAYAIVGLRGAYVLDDI